MCWDSIFFDTKQNIAFFSVLSFLNYLNIKEHTQKYKRMFARLISYFAYNKRKVANANFFVEVFLLFLFQWIFFMRQTISQNLLMRKMVLKSAYILFL